MNKNSAPHSLRGSTWQWIPVLLWMGLIFYLSAQPDLPGIPVLDKIDWSDKIKHFIAYAVLGVLAAKAIGRGSAKWLRLILPIMLAAAYGASDEWHQAYVPGRSCDVFDWTADVLGALTAAVVLVVLQKRKI